MLVVAIAFLVFLFFALLAAVFTPRKKDSQ